MKGKNKMIIKVINPATDAAVMTKKYISALYGCSIAEFITELEKEKTIKRDELNVQILR